MKYLIVLIVGLLAILSSSCQSARLQTHAYVKDSKTIVDKAYAIKVTTDRTSVEAMIKEYIATEIGKSLSIKDDAKNTLRVIYTSDMKVSGSSFSVGAGYYHSPWGYRGHYGDDIRSRRESELMIKLIDENGKLLWDAVHANYHTSDHKSARESVEIIAERLKLEIDSGDMSGLIEKEEKKN